MMEPVTGRTMKEYVVIPKAWRQEPVRVWEWVGRSLKWVGDMLEKRPKKSKKR